MAAATSAGAAIEASLTICGASSCRSLTGDYARFIPIVDLARQTPAPSVSRYYELELKIEGAPVQRGYFIPSARTARWLIPPRRFWIGLRPQDAELLGRLAEGRPFDAPAPVRAFVKGREVADPEPYARLFDRFRPGVPGADPPIPVRLEWEHPNPWVGEGPLSYSRRTDVLMRPSGAVKLPRALSARLERDSTAAPSVDSRSDGTPTTLIVVGAVTAGALALAVFLVAATRRRQRS